MDVPPEAAQLATEFVTRNLANIVSLGKGILKGAGDQVKLRLRRTYESYLTTAGERYGKAKSFFIRSAPTSIYDFYIPLGVSYGKKRFPKIKYADVVALTTRAVVTGPAGSGKSMLMRHLFLSALAEESKVPVFVELRNGNTHDTTVIDLIVSNLREHGFTLSESYISKALAEGHFAILLDGYDEIAHPRRAKVSRQILKLSKDAPKCTIMVSSRPDDIFSGWQDFSALHLNPLTLEEASELVSKLPYDEDIKSKFLKDLRKNLFRRHESFLSNPLLLSIMLLTYGMSADIPTKLSIFYNQAYEALFQRHDALKAGFQRDRLCDLDIQDFSKVFSAFCAQTYDRRLFQFSRSDALTYLEKAKKAADITVDNEKFLDDALQSVCLLVEDGLLLAFAHRSFQEYFVAKFISEETPVLQRKLIDRFWHNIRSDSVIFLLYEMNPNLVERDFLIPKLNGLFKKIGVRRKVGITHFVRFMKLTLGSVSRHDGNSIMATILESEAGYFDIVQFAIRTGPETSRDTIGKFDRAKQKKFIRKYFGKDKPEVYKLSTLTHRSPFFWDLSSLGGVFSITCLEAAYSEMKKLEAKHKRVERSLDELLSE